MTAEQSLLAIALIVPLMAALLAHWRPDGWGWHYVDLIYYPLGIVGVLLFFWAAERDRALVAARQELVETERSWRERPNERPSIEVDDQLSRLLRENHEQLSERERLGDSCRYAHGQSCIAYTRHADAIAATFGKIEFEWDSPDPEDRLRAQHRFCSRIPQLIGEVEAGGLDGQAYSTLRKHLANRRARNPFIPHHDDLARDIAGRHGYWLEATPLADRPLIRERYDVEGRFALLLYDAAANCARRPAGDQAMLRNLEEWRAEQSRRAAIEKEGRGKIESLTGQAADDGDRVRLAQLWQWPFLLILALALKFGKAVAGVESRRRRKSTESKVRADRVQPQNSDIVAGAEAGTDQL
jgi:hypothetical protein